MSEQHPKAKLVLSRHATLQRKRGTFDNVFQELRDLARPGTNDFNGGGNLPGQSRIKIFDGTAPWAAETLASALHSYLSNPVDRWFGFGVAGVPISDLTADEKLWIDEVAEVIYSHYSTPNTNLNPSIHEVYLDLSTFGTGVLYQWFDQAKGQLHFRSYPLSDCWIDEDENGDVIHVQRQMREFPVRSIRRLWGAVSERVAKMKDEDVVTVIHEIVSNEFFDPTSKVPAARRWEQNYVLKDTGDLLEESYLSDMPYHIPRWTRLAGELYGRGPAMGVLPEIRMVNAMSKTMIVAAQKMVDPPLMVEDDGYMLPIRTTPGAVINRRPGSEPIAALPGPQRMEVGIEMVEQRREMIRRGFYIDWVIRTQKKERQTAHEIMDERNQMLSQMAPIVGRLQRELLGPMIKLTYTLLARHGLLPPMPDSLRGTNLDLVYVSPAARAQSTARGQGLMSYIAQLTQLLPVMPNLLDSINEDRLNDEMQDQLDVPRRVLNTPGELKKKQQQREAQQQAALAAQTLPEAAKAARDFASARKDGLTVDV